MYEKEEIVKQLVKKYNLDLDKLSREQIKLSKNISIKDKIDFETASRIAGIDDVFFKNKIISAIVVIENGEVVEQEYAEDKIRFPYISGYRAYRELPTMVEAFNKLDEKPDLVFIRGNGILHPRKLGLASHFSLSINVPTIGVADSLLIGKVKREDIILNGEIIGMMVKTKQGANPIYVSPGNLISLDTSVKITKKFVREPHKLPEPLRLAKKYAKEVRKELYRD